MSDELKIPSSQVLVKQKKKLQKPIFEGDLTKLNVAYFSRRSKNMRHIVSYDKEALKTLQTTDNHTSVCGREFWVKAFGNDIQNFEVDRHFVCAKCLYNLGFSVNAEKMKLKGFEDWGHVMTANDLYYKKFDGNSLQDLIWNWINGSGPTKYINNN